MIRYQKNILIIFTIISTIIHGQDIKYVQYLIENDEYNFARNDLFKMFYTVENGINKNKISSYIAYCHQLEGNNVKAIEYYIKTLENDSGQNKDFMDSVKINLSIALFKSEKYEEAIGLLEKIDNNDSHNLYHQFSILTSDKNSIQNKDYTQEEINSFTSLQKSLKNPRFAAVLSALIPGVGQFYSNHYIDGAQSFFMVGVGMLYSTISYKQYKEAQSGLALPVITFCATSLFYYANLLSAYRTAIYRNIRLKKDYLVKYTGLIEPLNLMN